MGMEISEETAREFVRELYHFVLGRDQLSEREHADWAAALQRLADPILIFRKVAYSAEKRERDRLKGVSQTKYPNGHFFSPVVNREDALRDSSFIFRKRVPASVDLNDFGQKKLLSKLARHFQSVPFSSETDGKYRYNYGASGYGFGDAVVYWAMLLEFRPAQIIEIGCGSSSVLALDTIREKHFDTACTFIDPYPARLYELAGKVEAPHRVIQLPVQHIDLAILDSLAANDILFIDSSHVVKTGSDVHFELTEMLPRLPPGVIVHFHDMFYPFEYGYKWVIADNNSWNETYFVHAFLMYNSTFRIEFFNHYIATELSETLRAEAPEIADRFMSNPGGGLWLRKL